MEANQATILVVDDEAHIRQSIEKALTKEGYTVLQAGHGEHALEIMRERPINLAICDLRMPVMDGIQFLKAARAMRPETEVLIMTGPFGSKFSSTIAVLVRALVKTKRKQNNRLPEWHITLSQKMGEIRVDSYSGSSITSGVFRYKS